MLRIAIQSKGRLNEESLSLLGNIGIEVDAPKRKLLSRSQTFPIEALYLRDDDIPQVVAGGTANGGHGLHAGRSGARTRPEAPVRLALLPGIPYLCDSNSEGYDPIQMRLCGRRTPGHPAAPHGNQFRTMGRLRE